MKTSRSRELARNLVGLSLEKFATTSRADFRFAPLNALLMVGIFILGLVVHLARHPFSEKAVARATAS
jgi:hypothetical protein